MVINCLNRKKRPAQEKRTTEKTTEFVLLYKRQRRINKAQAKLKHTS
jgi:hypothetical protein